MPIDDDQSFEAGAPQQEPWEAGQVGATETGKNASEQDTTSASKFLEISGEQSAGALRPRPISTEDPATIPRRQWVYGRRLLRKSLTVTVAPPGMGKTMLSLHEAIAIAAGVTWAGQPVHAPGPVWMFNAEEDADELNRRLFAALAHMGVSLQAVQKRLFINNGADTPLSVAKLDDNGVVVPTPDVDACIEHIKRIGAVAFIVDPFIEVHEIEETSNKQFQQAAGLFRRIAQEANCAVNLCHHTRKPPAGSAEGHIGNMDSARGPSSLMGVARIAHTLYGMTERDAVRLDIADDDRHLYLRLDGAKNNSALIGGPPDWFKRESVTIANGDAVGVLTPIDLTEREDQARQNTEERHRSIIARLLTVVDTEMTINKAGLELIGQEETLFQTYRNKDFKGRCPTTVRKEIEAAVASGITVNGQTFQVADREGGIGTATRSAKMLVRTFGETDDDMGEIPF